MPDGRPFCPECGAPQVRVEIAAPPRPLQEEFPAGGVNLHQPVLTESASSPWQSAPDDRRIAGSAIIKAGLLGVLVGIIPLLGSVLTGVIAVWLYRRGGGSYRTAGLGARLGAAAAGLAFAISGLFTAVQVFVLHAQLQSEEAMRKLLSALGADLSDPEIQASIHRLFTPSGMLVSIILGLLVALALGAFGGAVAASSRPRPRR